MPKKLKGYDTIRCMPLQTLAREPVSRSKRNETLREYAQPASAIMTGKPQSGGLTFTIDQTVSPGLTDARLPGSAGWTSGRARSCRNGRRNMPSRQDGDEEAKGITMRIVPHLSLYVSAGAGGGTRWKGTDFVFQSLKASGRALSPRASLWRITFARPRLPSIPDGAPIQ
jgi:hypothetical protein